MRPALVAVAHGTRDLAGPGVIANLLDDVRRRLPGVDVISAWVELVEPGLDEVKSGMGRPAGTSATSGPIPTQRPCPGRLVAPGSADRG